MDGVLVLSANRPNLQRSINVIFVFLCPLLPLHPKTSHVVERCQGARHFVF